MYFSEDSETGTGSNGSVTLTVRETAFWHSLKLSTTGTVTAGTGTVSADGQDLSGTIDMTAPGPYVFYGHYGSVKVTAASFDGTNFTVRLRSSGLTP